jgi:uncharacterized membrane protein YphA (DoxX/SURF4 family)
LRFALILPSDTLIVCEREKLLRRLFSTFAHGWPGVGLLLLRLVAGTSLIIHGLKTLLNGQPIHPVTVLATAAGTLLLAGLWTPISGALVAALAPWNTFSQLENPWSCIFLATIGAALALVGPGKWSADAWLFGWKRMSSPD